MLQSGSSLQAEGHPLVMLARLCRGEAGERLTHARLDRDSQTHAPLHCRAQCHLMLIKAYWRRFSEEIGSSDSIRRLPRIRQCPSQGPGRAAEMKLCAELQTSITLVFYCLHLM